MKSQIVKIERGTWQVTLTETRMYNDSPQYNPWEYVTRRNFAVALRRGEDCEVITENQSVGRYQRCLDFLGGGRFQFGCCTFAPKEAAIIRKWALAKTRKVSKKKRGN